MLYDITNRENNIFLLFAKKYNLLEELFNPVYKEEKKLPKIEGHELKYSPCLNSIYVTYPSHKAERNINYHLPSCELLNKMKNTGVTSFKMESCDLKISKKNFNAIIDYIND